MLYWQFEKEHGNICTQMSIELKEFNAQNISNILWAMATMCFVPDQRFMTQLTRHVGMHLDEFSPQARRCVAVLTLTFERVLTMTLERVELTHARAGHGKRAVGVCHHGLCP